MSTIRVLIGKFPDNVNFGMLITLPGHDVTENMDDPEKCSFNSTWSDMVKYRLIGLANVPSTPRFLDIPYTSLGYKPFVEARVVIGNVIYDDLFQDTSVSQSGVSCTIEVDHMRLINPFEGMIAGLNGYTALYVVYAVPVPSG